MDTTYDDSDLLPSAAFRVQYVNPEEISFYRYVAFFFSLCVDIGLCIHVVMDGSIHAFCQDTAGWRCPRKHPGSLPRLLSSHHHLHVRIR